MFATDYNQSHNSKFQILRTSQKYVLKIQHLTWAHSFSEMWISSGSQMLPLFVEKKSITAVFN